MPQTYLSSMRALYLTGNPTILGVGQGGLRIREGMDERTILPPYLGCDLIVVQRARGYASWQALRVLLEAKLSVAFLDWRGRLIGQLVPYAGRTGDLHLRQLKAAASPPKRLAIARAIASEAYRRKGIEDGLAHARTLKDLMHLEAHVTQEYWAAWSERLSTIWPAHDFKGRARPDYTTNARALSRVNAVLNYAYSLLEAACRETCHRVGLSPEIGFLHLENVSKEPMVYDLQEYGRGWVDEAALDYFKEPSHRKGFFRTEDWVMHLSAERARDLVQFMAPRIDGPQLWRDARSVVKRL